MRRIVVIALLLSLLPATNSQADSTDALTALNKLEVTPRARPWRWAALSSRTAPCPAH